MGQVESRPVTYRKSDSFTRNQNQQEGWGSTLLHARRALEHRLTRRIAKAKKRHRGEAVPIGGELMKSLEEKQAASKWFSDEANWFALFVRTYEERRVMEQLQSKLDTDRYAVFVPTKDYAFSKNGIKTIRRVPWLSGYVFIASTVSPEVCLEDVRFHIYRDPHIYKMLSNDGHMESTALSEHDKSIMTAILDEEFNIPAIEGVMVDDRVVILDGAFRGVGGKVVKVNKHRQTATLELDIQFFGRPTALEVMLNIIERPEYVRFL
jgi:transcriptional antiterminator NusG